MATAAIVGSKGSPYSALHEVMPLITCVGELGPAAMSKFSWRVTVLEGTALENRKTSSFNGVTNGVVSGVASIAGSGGGSRVASLDGGKLFRPAWLRLFPCELIVTVDEVPVNKLVWRSLSIEALFSSLVLDVVVTVVTDTMCEVTT